MMNRRDALQLLATVALSNLASGKMMAARQARAVLGGQSGARTLDSHQFATTRALAEAILPRTDTPGAADVGVSEFIDLLLTEWYDEAERAQFVRGLSEVDVRMRGLFGKDFVDCSADQQAECMRELGERMMEEADPARVWEVADSERSVERQGSFYPMLRRLTLTGYYTSEAGATEALHYQIIPDRHEQCVEIQAAKQTERP